MFYVVDIQYTESYSKNDLRRVGIYDTITDSISYYTVKELDGMMRKDTSYKTKVQGLEYRERPDTFQPYVHVTVQKHKDITFVDTLSSICIDTKATYMLDCNIGKTLTRNKMTIFRRPFKIVQPLSGISIWISGVHIMYKKGVDNRETGYNVEGTINWIKSKTRYFGGSMDYKPVDESFLRDFNWPTFMTSEYFVNMLNEISKYYYLTGFYRLNLPRCKELNLSGLNVSSISNIHEMFYNTNSIRRIYLDDLDLSNIIDGIDITHHSGNIEIIDFSRAKNDIRPNIMFNYVKVGFNSKIIILVNESQINLLNMLSKTAIIRGRLKNNGQTRLDDKEKAKLILLDKTKDDIIYIV